MASTVNNTSMATTVASIREDGLATESFYGQLLAKTKQGVVPNPAEGERILTDPHLSLLLLLEMAYRVRQNYFKDGVRIHILDNLQNGLCSEDCSYCAQAVDSQAPIKKYAIKSEEEILQGAKRAAEQGCFRYCLVLSGRGPNIERAQYLAHLVQKIKQQFHGMEVCLSAGFLDVAMAKILKEAGLDRYNHNLNTAASHYGHICSTHEYQDRLSTLKAARTAQLEVCSGIIIGMGESPTEIVEVALTLRHLQARSIPVNFYTHVPGNRLGAIPPLTPEYGLRALCLFRMCNPDAEIRAAGGREINLRSLEALALYPANSIFSDGYLNTSGHNTSHTIKMIEDAGFFVEHTELQ